MVQLIALPFQIFFTLLTSVLATAQYIITFSVNMVFTLVSTLAPYAGAVLLFVSNEKGAKGTLVVENQRPPSPRPAISSPEDGEWFSRLFEKNIEIEITKIKNGKIEFTLPNTGEMENRIVYLNLYSAVGENAPNKPPLKANLPPPPH